MASNPLSAEAIALNRFGLGARAAQNNPTDSRRWLLDQFDRFEPLPPGFAQLPDAGSIVREYLQERRAMRQQARAAGVGHSASPGGNDPRKAMRRDFVQQVQALARQALAARVQSALATEAPFVERMVHFWANHFCISADNPQTTAFAGAFERDAIRPHVLGRFEDMMLAAEQHPAMLIYLNQVQSIGPDSPVARRVALRNPGRARGLNENLGREIMELHTLGVRSGYSQADVTEFARALTGWSVGGLGGPGAPDGTAPVGFIFRPMLHEPGPRTIMGRRYDQPGEAQARAALIDFARAPQAATHIATKLARHFAGDTPPPALVTRLAATFRQSRGDLPALYRTLIQSPEPWEPRPLKFKTPWEWTISSLRGLGLDQAGQMQATAIEVQLGQPVWKPGAPAGWDDTTASWAAPDALLRRVEMAQRFAALAGDRIDARTLGPRLMPASLDPATAQQIARAESPASALALLLVSPDFLRR